MLSGEHRASIFNREAEAEKEKKSEDTIIGPVLLLGGSVSIQDLWPLQDCKRTKIAHIGKRGEYCTERGYFWVLHSCKIRTDTIVHSHMAQWTDAKDL